MNQLVKPSGIGMAIVQKELILRFRRFRSLVIQLIFAAVLGGAMWIASLNSSIGGSVSPEDHAQWLVTVFFSVQLAALFLVIPALGAVSITTERLGKTWDLLIGTDLSPGEIVRGKLLGLLGMAFYFMFLPAPLLALTSLFGGVSIGSILFEYFFQMLIALLLGGCALLSSAASRGTARAILQVLPVSGFGMMFTLGFLTNEVYSEGLLVLDYILQTQPPLQFWLLSIPMYIFAVVGTLMGATYFLSGTESSREIPIRILVLAIFLTVGAIYLYSIAPFMGMGTSTLTRGHGEFLIICIGFVPLVVLRMAGGGPRVPLRVAQIYQRGNPITRIGYFLLPGGIRNLVYPFILFCIPFVLVWILKQIELGNLAQVSPNFDLDRFHELMGHFGDRLIALFLWGVSVIALCWLFAQLGFGSIVSSALTIGVHVSLLMFVVTMSVITAGGISNPTTIPGSYLSPLWMIGFASVNSQVSTELLNDSNLFSIVCTVLFIAGGVLTSKGKGLPVFMVQRPGMDQLYLELPKEES
ncbi:MAG: hypothetical protein VX764_03285 [Planctomycetota bacterium]|nr:hypothetical protein [Planctomycetota bacterium]